MYEHARAVTWGLILSAVFVIAAAIVAVIDPYVNGIPWANWLTLSVVSIASVVVSTMITSITDDEKEFWVSLSSTWGIWLFVGGMLVGLFLTEPTYGIRPEYHSLTWSAYAVPLCVLPVSGLVQYLVAAAAHRRRDISRLRQVA